MQKETLSNPHDKFFKESFGRKEVALSFIKEYLPVELRKKIDYESVALSKSSYIDKELSEHFSDILYSLKINGKNGFLYLLFEHKSYADRWAAFQLLRNMVKIWEECFKQNKKINRLPIIVPLVIYHGKEKWNVAESIVSLC